MYAIANLPKSALMANIVIRVPANEVLDVTIIKIVSMEWFVKKGHAFQNRVVIKTRIANQTKKYARITYAFHFNSNHAKMTLTVMADCYVTMDYVPNADTISNAFLDIFVD